MPTFNEERRQRRRRRELTQRARRTRFGADAFQIVRTEAVGPKVGSELQQRALLAILISFVLTLIYLAFRFEWRFGVAAVVATVHDIIITLGFLAILRSEISIGTVAAFLTIVGYSLNDTIIVFDRIRENLAKRMRGDAVHGAARPLHQRDAAANRRSPRAPRWPRSSRSTSSAAR